MENRVCKNCGAEVAADHVFCTNCGTPMPSQDEATLSNADDNITSENNSDVYQAPATAQAYAEQPQPYAEHSQPYAEQPHAEQPYADYPQQYPEFPTDYPQPYAEQPYPEYPQHPTDYPPQPPQKKSSSLGLIIAIVALVSLLLGGLTYFLIRHFTSEEAEAPSPPPVRTEQEDTGDAGSSDTPTEDEAQAEDEEVEINIIQIDNTDFPIISFYANILDKNNKVIEDLTRDSFEILELDETGRLVEVEIEELRQVLMTDNVSINMVMDKSGSMSDYNRMSQAQNAAAYFLGYLGGYTNSFVELTFFDDYIYVPHTFTSNFDVLTQDIYMQIPGGSTALYDAIYAALLTTNNQRGAKCVIVFTDGEENASSSTFDDVVNLAQATGIPVYIVGVGYEVDESALIMLANLAGGSYFSSQNDNLEEELKKVYREIYDARREMYVVRYKSIYSNELDSLRKMVFRAKSGKGYSGETEREYVPVPNIKQGFSDTYWDKDFILDFSSDRAITDADLRDLSLAELRIARNEVFARHGRMFVDPMLNKWFYSKNWYLAISPKYSPDQFNVRRPYPLSRIETDNVNKILALENHIMEFERIFPNSSSVRLTEYDVSLRKEVLQRGLDEIFTYAGVQSGDKNALNDIERYNAEMIEYALSQPDIQY